MVQRVKLFGGRLYGWSDAWKVPLSQSTHWATLQAELFSSILPQFIRTFWLWDFNIWTRDYGDEIDLVQFKQAQSRRSWRSWTSQHCWSSDRTMKTKVEAVCITCLYLTMKLEPHSGISLGPGPTSGTTELFTLQGRMKGPTDQSNSQFPTVRNLAIGHAVSEAFGGLSAFQRRRDVVV